MWIGKLIMLIGSALLPITLGRPDLLSMAVQSQESKTDYAPVREQNNIQGELATNNLDFDKTESSISSPFVAGTKNGSILSTASHRIGNLRRTIPGEPLVDYPIFSQPPHSSFNCTGRHDGYYADLEARCQVFRVCANTDLTGQGFAFLCPNGTLFNQKVFVCDWYSNVNCPTSEKYYNGNEGAHIGLHEEMMEHVKQMIQFPLSEPNNNSTTEVTHKYPLATITLPYTSKPTLSMEKTTQPSVRLQPSNRLPEFSTVAPQRFDELRPNIATPSQSPETFKIWRDMITGNRGPSTTIGTPVLTPQRIYVSSLGELSTDINSGFDINKSRFLVVDSDERNETKLAAKDNKLVSLLQEQVTLLGQSKNDNGKAELTQINKTGSRFLPRIIASNVIVPLPKVFQRSSQNHVKVVNDVRALPNPPPNELETITTDQFPTIRFPFPGIQDSLPLPSSPMPFTMTPLFFKWINKESDASSFFKANSALPSTGPRLQMDQEAQRFTYPTAKEEEHIYYSGKSHLGSASPEREILNPMYVNQLGNSVEDAIVIGSENYPQIYSLSSKNVLDSRGFGYIHPQQIGEGSISRNNYPSSEKANQLPTSDYAQARTQERQDHDIVGIHQAMGFALDDPKELKAYLDVYSPKTYSIQ